MKSIRLNEKKQKIPQFNTISIRKIANLFTKFSAITPTINLNVTHNGSETKKWKIMEIQFSTVYWNFHYPKIIPPIQQPIQT
jgi:hypothetical protein